MTLRRLLPMLLFAGACGGAAAGGPPAVAPVAGAEALSGSQLDSLWTDVQSAFRRGKWAETRMLAARFRLEAPAADSRLVESRMLEAEAQFGMGERLEAAREFRRIADEHPTHPLAPNALLRVGDAYAELWRRPELDPTYGESALVTYQEAQSRFPGTDAAARAGLRVAELQDMFAAKAYTNAKYYLRFKAWDSAIIYLRDLLANYPTSESAPAAVVDLIQVYHTLGYAEDARETCGYLRRFHPGAPGTDDVCPPEAAQGP